MELLALSITLSRKARRKLDATHASAREGISRRRLFDAATVSIICHARYTDTL